MRLQDGLDLGKGAARLLRCFKRCSWQSNASVSVPESGRVLSRAFMRIPSPLRAVFDAIRVFVQSGRIAGDPIYQA
jgi:hypothetical protein